MKTKNTSFDKFSDKELAESFVFPAKRTDEQRQNDSIAIKKLRDESIHKGSDETKMIFHLLQLKYNMEDYIRKATYDEHMSFGSFLKKYVHLANRKQKDFAEEIGMKATELSQIINRHRKPPYGFVIRLEIHSNSAISAICWNRLIEKENEFELMNDKNIWNRERKHVKSRLDIRI